jgi:hypothetical protein
MAKVSEAYEQAGVIHTDTCPICNIILNTGEEK